MALFFSVWEAHAGDKFVIDKSLVREASLKATGADVHDVKDLIAAYHGACTLADLESRLNHPDHQLSSEEKTLLTKTLLWRRSSEVALRAYVAGMPIKKAIAYAERVVAADDAVDTNR